MNDEQLQDWYRHPVTVELMKHLNEQCQIASTIEFRPGFNSDQLGLLTAHNAGVAKGLSEILYFYKRNNKKFQNEIHNAQIKNKHKLAS